MHIRHLLLAFFIGVVVFGARSFDSDLRKDNVWYAALSKEMLTSDNRMIPSLDEQPQWQKPPLFYWINAGVMALAGPSVFGAKLFTVLGGAANLVLVFLLTRRISKDADTALFAAFFAAITYGVLRAANACRMENMVIGLSLAALLAALAYRDARRARWMVLFGLAVGLIALTKGYIAILPLVAWWLYVALCDRGLFGAAFLRDQVLLLAAAAVSAGWWYAYALGQPGFSEVFFYNEAVNRLRDAGSAASDPWFSYIPMWLQSCLIFVPFLVLGVKRIRGEHLGDPTLKLLAVYLVIVLVVIHLLATKYDRYLLPVYYGTAMVAALGVPVGWRPAACKVVLGVSLFASAAVSLLPLPFLHRHDYSILARADEFAAGLGLPLVVHPDVRAYWESRGAASFFLEDTNTPRPATGPWLEVRRSPDETPAPTLIQSRAICVQVKGL